MAKVPLALGPGGPAVDPLTVDIDSIGCPDMVGQNWPPRDSLSQASLQAPKSEETERARCDDIEAPDMELDLPPAP
jgi:hypothetical protein